MDKKSSSKKVVLKPEFIPILEQLQTLGKPIEARELSALLKIEYEVLMSGAIYSLQQQGLASFSEETVEIISLTPEGETYGQKGLPERQLWQLFVKNGRKEITVKDFQNECESALKMDKKLFFIGLSNIKKNRWVRVSKATQAETIFADVENPPLGKDEKLLELIMKSATKSFKITEIPADLKDAVNQLYSRKLLNREKKTLRVITLTSEGKSVKKSQIGVIENEIFHLTAEMIKSGSWKDQLPQMKKYEVNALGPRINVGKTHPMTNIINEIREIFHAMGFSEIKGPIIEMAFFNFDALYQPQDHPAREMHDTFYLTNPKEARLPASKVVNAIKAVHENGGDTGSMGWRYNWSEDIAKKMLLRTHTTATTLRYLSTFANDAEKNGTKLSKVFCIDRVFRNEKVDWKHLAEFQQIEGIVIGENVTLCNLIGQIVEFYKRMGFSKVVTRPGFFPYTEPSMEIAVYSEELGKWLEMGGSGMFRPEVTYPWGIKNPMRVLAWGMGLERLAMLKLKRNDIRDLYQSPISWLREVPY